MGSSLVFENYNHLSYFSYFQFLQVLDNFSSTAVVMGMHQFEQRTEEVFLLHIIRIVYVQKLSQRYGSRNKSGK
ncbi:hypothetical protein LguiA_035625 [Lonicera macranthoides]